MTQKESPSSLETFGPLESEGATCKASVKLHAESHEKGELREKQGIEGLAKDIAVACQLQFPHL